MRPESKANLHTLCSLRAATEAGITVITRENEQLGFVTDELRHRIKNLVAVIQSIARQTMHQAATKDDFEERFSGRLGAFGRSLDLLIANDWHGARIDELVRSELTAFGGLEGAQISVDGPPISLKPEAVRNIGLALHELATNASKYGALSLPEGKVVVHWELANSDGRRRFLMTWREAGGPAVTEPTRWGFGRQVIQRLTEQAFAGRVVHEFAPDGVRWTLDVPAEFVVSARDHAASFLAGLREGATHEITARPNRSQTDLGTFRVCPRQPARALMVKSGNTRSL
jgi:two-component sensor histidine kinase